ncbi:MAG: LacI family DNA-binding transcriptional regulator [Thermoanaerobaculia bacterium]
MTEERSNTRRNRRHERHPTIRDVAARANVSVATVSRVFSGKDIVREETSIRVREIARTLGYVPNVAARALSVRRSHTIGILLPDIHGEFFSELLRGIDIAARGAGYHILVSGWHSDLEEMIAMTNAFRGRVDGILVMAPDISVAQFRERVAPRIPVVLLNTAAHAELDSIVVDNSGGARAVMRHLRELGHERIAFVNGPSRNLDARERRRGYRHGLQTAAPPLAPLEIPGDFTEESGYASVETILEMEPRPTAVFAANDSMAIGILAGLAEHGVSVPDEISVVGFDDILISRYVNPPLTTVRIDVGHLGRRAFALLQEAFDENGQTPLRRERVSTSLVVRQSTSPRRPGHARPAQRRTRDR